MAGFFILILDILFVSLIVVANAMLFFLLGDNTKVKIEKKKLIKGIVAALVLIVVFVLSDSAKYYGFVATGPILVLLTLLSKRFIFKGLSTMGVSREEMLHSFYHRYLVPGMIVILTIILCVHFFIFPPD